MTKTKNTKHLIITTSLALILCLATLFGTTFAWFSKTATSAENTVKSADFGVTLQLSNAYGSDYVDFTTSSVLFNGTNASGEKNILMPGENTTIKYIKITNNNGYAVKAKIDVGTVTTKVGNTETDGTNELHLYAATVTGTATFDGLADKGLLAAGSILPVTTIAAGGSIVVAVAVALPDAATKANQVSKFTVTVGATQTTNSDWNN